MFFGVAAARSENTFVHVTCCLASRQFRMRETTFSATGDQGQPDRDSSVLEEDRVCRSPPLGVLTTSASRNPEQATGATRFHSKQASLILIVEIIFRLPNRGKLTSLSYPYKSPSPVRQQRAVRLRHCGTHYCN